MFSFFQDFIWIKSKQIITRISDILVQYYAYVLIMKIHLKAFTVNSSLPSVILHFISDSHVTMDHEANSLDNVFHLLVYNHDKKVSLLYFHRSYSKQISSLVSFVSIQQVSQRTPIYIDRYTQQTIIRTVSGSMWFCFILFKRWKFTLSRLHYSIHDKLVWKNDFHWWTDC